MKETTKDSNLGPAALPEHLPDLPLPSEADVLAKKDFHTEFEKRFAQGGPMVVMFMDANGFKDVNDVLGHDFGDQVIADINTEVVGKVAAQTPNTFAGHIGGDEFGLFAHADEVEGQIIRESLRHAFQEYINQPGKEKLKELGIGLAIGLGVRRADMKSPGELLSMADFDMYDDKIRQLPELDDHQKQAIVAARFLLKNSGVRLRDVPKYIHKIFGEELE